MSKRAFIYLLLIVAIASYVDVQENVERAEDIEKAARAGIYEVTLSGCLRDMEDHDYLTADRCEKIARDLVNAYFVDQ